jgi:ATP-binding cassette subfamily F protein uup
VIKPAVKPQATTPAAPKAPPARLAKLSYKDQRRLAELEALTIELPGKISALEADLADPALYARDPTAFDRLNRALEAARDQLGAAEEEWLALEEQREALENRR